MKRVKKGYERHGEARWFERAGALCIEQLRGVERHTVVLSTSECEALGITAALEDVPEPWERARAAWLQAWRDAYGESAPFSAPGAEHATVWQRMAEILGIKPEGES